MSEEKEEIPPGQTHMYEAHPGKTNDSTLAIDTRPLRVAPILHRAHVAARNLHIKVWQESWRHPAVHGNAKTHEVIEPYIDMTLDADKARIAKQWLDGLLLDAYKFKRSREEAVYWIVLYSSQRTE